MNPPTIDLRIANALERFKLHVKHLFREKIENCFDDADFILSSNCADYVLVIPNDLERENTLFELSSDLGLNTDDNDFEECCEYDIRVMRESFKTLGRPFYDGHTTFTYGRTIRTCLWRTDCLVGLNLFKCFLSI